jgi:peroxiredoxin
MKILPIFAIFLLTIQGCSSVAADKTERPASVAVLAPGALQPLQVLTDIQGQPIRLDQPQQRKLLIFFATWCSDSQRAIRQIQASALVQQQDLQIVGIGREETVASLSKFAADYQLSFPLVADPDRQLYQQFTNSGIPRLVLVDQQNRIVRTFLAEIPDVMPELQWTPVAPAASATSH